MLVKLLANLLVNSCVNWLYRAFVNGNSLVPVLVNRLVNVFD